MNSCRDNVQVCRKVMVGTTGDQKFASLEKIIVPLESVQRDESKYVFFYDIIQTNKNFAEKINFLVATQYSPVLFPHPHESPNRRGAAPGPGRRGLGRFAHGTDRHNRAVSNVERAATWLDSTNSFVVRNELLL